MINLQKHIIRFSAGILFMTAVSPVCAQESSTTEPSKPARTEKSSPVYEMREVCGLVIDAATHKPIVCPRPGLW